MSEYLNPGNSEPSLIQIYDAMNFMASAQASSALQAIRLFANFCLMPGARFDDDPIQTAPGISPDTVVAMVAYLKAFYINVYRREGPQHGQWNQFSAFAEVCTAKVLDELPKDDVRNLFFQRTTGHTPGEILSSYSTRG